MEKQIVENMISLLSDRGGFDDWWGDIGWDIKEEIINELEINIKNIIENGKENI
jgi:hypothetical protein